MTSNQKFDRSRRVYTRLLSMFPREHRDEYGASMLQVFTDQLREASQPNGGGVFALWLRTLWDLGISAIKEQFSSPHLTAGLLEAVPNQPLPWKGVALVLVPGIAFFIAQLVQLTGQDWFYWMTYRAGYYLILPVLIVWVWRKKFPLWGLVPLGLFFRTVWNLAYRAYNGEFSLTYPQWFSWLKWGEHTGDSARIGMLVAVVVVILVLIVLIARRQHLPRKAWYWLAAFIALCAAYVGGTYWIYASNGAGGGISFLWFVAPSILYESIGLLVLILLGSFFARHHGRLAMLLLMGYLLPTVVYGRFINYWVSLPDNVVNTYLLIISITVLVYRFIIALAAPVWVVRSAAPGAQRKASLITLLICVGIQAAMNIGVGIFMTLNYQYTGFTWLTWYVTFAAELVMVAGVGLAATLYADPPPEPQSAPLPVGALEYK
ncbi:MAG: hypothetical protein VB013_11685 [Anaerolineaceae bacterium]|nr:hypothetical protein [Anaerolineaceae bacterium]